MIWIAAYGWIGLVMFAAALSCGLPPQTDEVPIPPPLDRVIRTRLDLTVFMLAWFILAWPYALFVLASERFPGE